jgi:hypothetical protein
VNFKKVSVDFRIDGVMMTAGNAPAALRPQLAAIEDDVRRRLGDLREAKTGLPPKVLMEGQSVANLQFTIKGTKELIEEAQKRMGRG